MTLTEENGDPALIPDDFQARKIVVFKNPFFQTHRNRQRCFIYRAVREDGHAFKDDSVVFGLFNSNLLWQGSII